MGLRLTNYPASKVLHRAVQHLYKTFKDMAFHDEITSVFKSRQFHMTTSNTETWEATLDGDRVKMKIDHQSRLSRVE
jgi:hypothetical protein